MDNTKRALAEEATEKEIPRAAYEGVLTIDVDAQVESMEEQEDARWHQLLNAHRTRKVLTGVFLFLWLPLQVRLPITTVSVSSSP